MADNMDHNSATDTFHGMGIICAITPPKPSTLFVESRTDIRLQEIMEKAKIDVRYHREDINGLKKINIQMQLVTLMI